MTECRAIFHCRVPDREFDDPDGTLLPGHEAAIDCADVWRKNSGKAFSPASLT
jgi:hypothetical protein